MKVHHISGMRRMVNLSLLSNCFLSFGFAIATILSLDYSLPLSFNMGMFFGGHFFSPDIAFPNSYASQSWSSLSVIWNPYRNWAKNRLRTNSAFVIGVTIRLVYFYVCVQLAIGLFYALALNLGIAVPPPIVVRKIVMDAISDRLVDIEVFWMGAVVGCSPSILLFPLRLIAKRVKGFKVTIKS